eukprot:TRINITY_DN1286_c1_g4_i1.p1 TRINITY_DN1286_c1_g4~~TRINITY_DN1286_c1_g4_i1.p1  ORF type:complete len:191 (-),score=36.67 TRINITY_DN1286_c1_g4_i1:154-726(-)
MDKCGFIIVTPNECSFYVYEDKKTSKIHGFKVELPKRQESRMYLARMGRDRGGMIRVANMLRRNRVKVEEHYLKEVLGDINRIFMTDGHVNCSGLVLAIDYAHLDPGIVKEILLSKFAIDKTFQNTITRVVRSINPNIDCIMESNRDLLILLEITSTLLQWMYLLDNEVSPHFDRFWSNDAVAKDVVKWI